MKCGDLSDLSPLFMSDSSFVRFLRGCAPEIEARFGLIAPELECEGGPGSMLRLRVRPSVAEAARTGVRCF